ncbi:sulfite exporter TauE/SafE family protein [Alteromonas sp. ASW11-130]|uniref:sulfite exporter TauE/SafE family protein n=1 Tax=Alteromonas sp. ASW11-130 TaxID=3015775 RepID=UPI002242105E|nr:sulfite exporter TauE/SafE family protein [Alteromonas sp. ASW11-130]MCW8092370.1 sulfite exporter TauE/SafE family protein [Alteromonas sp. ASW11-130]
MNELSLTSAFLIGLAGGVHCLGMCGGIVGAFRMLSPSNENIGWYSLSYNVGRISSYTIAGIIAGTMSSLSVAVMPGSKLILFILSAFMLIAMACYLGQWWNGLVAIEKVGSRIWTIVQPWSKRFLPFKTPLHALPYGFIWGWLPCGLVYSTLTWALASGSAVSGGLIMLFFGLGTLPTMFAAAIGIEWLMKGLRHPILKQVIAISLACFGLFQLYFATQHF